MLKKIKLVFQRSQSEKVIQRKLVGKNGVIIKNKGDIHYIDCNVTGSNDGTPKDPNFYSNMPFEKCLFTVIDKLVCDGGPFEVFDPVIQNDNVVPHQDAKLYNYVVKLCRAKQWPWEPQIPQMPHMNVLDLAVFPTVSRLHSHLIQSLRGMGFSKEYNIWEISAKVWEELPSCKIANKFCLENNITEKISKFKGDTILLAGAKGGLASELGRSLRTLMRKTR